MAEVRKRGYIPQEIEPKWQEVWRQRGVMRADDASSKPKYYNLVMFPYPSGELHMGHMKNYTIGDLYSRFMRMRGFEVLNPFGWDAFGLPAENAAIAKGTHPETETLANIVIAKRQLPLMGILYDWDREVTTCLPDYYRWTQWLFLLFHRKGMAYRKMSPVNWCPIDKTVLANEQVINGCCWRHLDTPVEKRDLEQWFLKITDYADRLLDDLSLLDGWPEKVRTMQANWIGRSQGVEIDFQIEGFQELLCVYTTRPDTLYGATFMVLAPEHPLVERVTDPARLEDGRAYVERAWRVPGGERLSPEAAKTGGFTGPHRGPPVNRRGAPAGVPSLHGPARPAPRRCARPTAVPEAGPRRGPPPTRGAPPSCRPGRARGARRWRPGGWPRPVGWPGTRPGSAPAGRGCPWAVRRTVATRWGLKGV